MRFYNPKIKPDYDVPYIVSASDDKVLAITFTKETMRISDCFSFKQTGVEYPVKEMVKSVRDGKSLWASAEVEFSIKDGENTIESTTYLGGLYGSTIGELIDHANLCDMSDEVKTEAISHLSGGKK